jgi:hypothetical protein
VLDVGGPKLTGSLRVVQEGGDLGWYLRQDVFGRIDRKVAKVLLGKVDNEMRELAKAFKTRYSRNIVD